MIIIGLTGEIGSGKTTTSNIVRSLGYNVFDCDESTKKILYEKQAILEIEQMFNGKIKNLITSNRVNTELLGNYVFSKPKELIQLENFIHPKIKKREKIFLLNNSMLRKKIVFLDIPLMFRKKNYLRCDYVINLIIYRKIQEQRVLIRPGMHRDKFKHILNQQFYQNRKFNRFKSININTGNGVFDVRKKIIKFLKVVKNRNKRRVWPKRYHLLNKT